MTTIDDVVSGDLFLYSLTTRDDGVSGDLFLYPLTTRDDGVSGDLFLYSLTTRDDGVSGDLFLYSLTTRDDGVSGDLFLLVYSIDSRDSFNETKRLLEQLLQVKQQATGKAVRTVPKPVLLLVANKTDKEQERDVPFHELKDLADSYQVRYTS